jgi:hypothetical protein
MKYHVLFIMDQIWGYSEYHGGIKMEIIAASNHI